MADYAFDQIGCQFCTLGHFTRNSNTKLIQPELADRLPQIYYTLNRLKVDTDAFAQLTRKYMTETFNPNTPDVDDIRCVPNSSSSWLPC